MSSFYAERDVMRKRVMLEFPIFLMLNALDFLTTLPLASFEANPIAKLLLMLPLPLAAGIKMILFPFIALMLIKLLEFRHRYKLALLSIRFLVFLYLAIVSLNTMQLAHSFFSSLLIS